MKKFVAGLLLGILLTVGLPLLVLAAGGFNVAATEEPGTIEMKLAHWARERSIRQRAAETTNPLAGDPAVLPSGMALYRQSCVMCHGADDVDAAPFAEGLNPAPPPLTGEELRHRSDGEIFWIIENGIRMTGMPAFYDAYEADEIWKIVAYVRHLPDITAAEMEYLGSADEPEGRRDDELEAPDEEGSDEMQNL